MGRPESTRNLVVQVDQDRAESYLGASEAAGVLGLDKWSPPIKIWRKHRGLPVHDDGDNEPALWGTLFEPVIRGHYAIKHERLIAVPTASITLDDWIRCTCDGYDLGWSPRGSVIEWDQPTVPAGTEGTLQIKTCSAYLLDDWREGPPPKYEVQCRVEMAVTGLPYCDIVCLVGGQKLVGPFRLLRDDAAERRILGSLREFWAMVQNGDEPSVDHTDAWRLHVSEKMERARAITVIPSATFITDINEWRASRVAVKQAEEREGELRNQILLQLSAAGATRVDAGALGKIGAYRTSTGTWAIRAPSHWKEDRP